MTAWGVFVSTALKPGPALTGIWTTARGKRRRAPMLPRRPSQADPALVGEMLAERSLKPGVGKRYKATDLPEALRHLEGGHARGEFVEEM
jgi:NADPH:quinone reductase-like Zn-dependent oxidoreductase